MHTNNRQAFDKLISKTKIYLVIIAVLLVALCIYDTRLIVPSLILYVIIVAYSLWANNKRKAEISKHVQNLTFSVDSTARKTLINSPFPLVIVETDGNIIWKSEKFVSEFANIDIGNYLEEIILDIKEDIENAKDDKNRSIAKQIKIENSHYRVVGEYVKSKSNERKKENKYMAILYFIDITKQLEIIEEYNDSKLCLGIVMVDNYEEIMQRISNEARPQILAEIEKNIYEWRQRLVV